MDIYYHYQLLKLKSLSGDHPYINRTYDGLLKTLEFTKNQRVQK